MGGLVGSSDATRPGARWTVNTDHARPDHPRTRRATRADLDEIVETLVVSHVDYVWEQWLIPDARRRTSVLEMLFRLDVDTIGLPHGDVWITERSTSVAVWLPTDIELTPEEDHRIAQGVDLLGDRAVVAHEVDSIMARPTRAKWLLATMGTRPDSQRRGLGSAVLQPKLLELDGAGHIARLDTSDPHNVRFYSRFGFTIVATHDRLPHGAPRTWTMERVPGTPSSG